MIIVMIKYFKDFVERSIKGAFLMALSVFGIPFIPFVPLVVLLGGFKWNGSLGDGLGSIAVTMMLGIIGYLTLAVMIVHGV